MTNVLLITIAGDVKDPFYVLGHDYLKRTRAPFFSEHKNIAAQKRNSSSNLNLVEAKEGETLFKASEGYFRIALDESGSQMTSVQFTAKLSHYIDRGQQVAFMLGGASGHAQAFIKKCDAVWSLSQMTFPHRMAFCVLAEQIYRASEILRNSPYHK